MHPKVTVSDVAGGLDRWLHIHGMGLIGCLNERSTGTHGIDRNEVVGCVAARWWLTHSRLENNETLLVEPLVVEERMPFDMIVLERLQEGEAGFMGHAWKPVRRQQRKPGDRSSEQGLQIGRSRRHGEAARNVAAVEEMSWHVAG